MTKVNKQFIEAKQARLDEKESIYQGELNYENMSIFELTIRLREKYYQFLEGDKDIKIKRLIDISNFCGFLWEKIGDKK